MTDETGPTWTCEWCGITHHAAALYAAHVLVCAAAKRPSWRDDLDNLLATAGEAQWVEEIDGRLTAQLAELQQLRAERDRLKARRIPAGTLAKEVASMLNDWDERSSVSRALRAIADQGDARVAALEAELSATTTKAYAIQCGYFAEMKSVNELESALEARDRLIAEIVAWFDVVEQKADEVIMDEWPTDWLGRARAAAMQRGGKS